MGTAAKYRHHVPWRVIWFALVLAILVNALWLVFVRIVR